MANSWVVVRRWSEWTLQRCVDPRWLSSLVNHSDVKSFASDSSTRYRILWFRLARFFGKLKMLSRRAVQTHDNNKMIRLGRMKMVQPPYITHIRPVSITDGSCCQFTRSATTMPVSACMPALMTLSSALPHCGAGMEAASEVQNSYAEKAIMHQMTCHDVSRCLG